MQWTKQARQYLLQEIHKDNQQFIKEIQKNAVHTLQQQNAKRQEYRLPPHKRVTKDIIKQTIINLMTDNNLGDAEKEETKKQIIYEGGMYT